MATHATFAALKKSLPHLAAAYAEGRLRHEALPAYATPAEVLASLQKSSTVHPLVRNGIVGALILEHRRGPNTVWQTLLLLAFEPMIVGLYRARTRKGANEDVEQALLLAFLDALGVVEVGRFTVLAVRAATMRGFEALRTAVRPRMPRCRWRLSASWRRTRGCTGGSHRARPDSARSRAP